MHTIRGCIIRSNGDFTLEHGLINYSNTKTKYRHRKIWTCKGTLRVFVRLVIQSVMLVFQPSCVNCYTSNPLSGSNLSPPPPFPVWINILWRYFNTFKELSNRFQGINSASLCCLASQYDNPIHVLFLQELHGPHIMFKNSSTEYTYSVCKGGGVKGFCSGPQTDKHLPKSPFTGQFFYLTTFCISFYEFYLSTHWISAFSCIFSYVANLVFAYEARVFGIACTVCTRTYVCFKQLFVYLQIQP